MNIESEFEQFMRTANPAVTKGSVQYVESRRVWYAALWSLLNYISGPQSDEASVIRIMEEVAKFPKYINKPNN